MKRVFKKTGKIILWIIGIIVGLIILSMVTGFTLHNTYFKQQLKKIDPYGVIVEVDNKNMHVYSMGDGEETIVLLPGHGVPLPSVDFGPLMRKLSEKYRVVTVEYFGVGFSDGTDKPRTSQAYMDEIRGSLKQAGIKPPYILMPHSISGVYSEYYATKYPEEVKGLILLDTTSTAFVIDIPKEEIAPYKTAKFIYNIGLQRLFLSIISDEDLKKSGFAITKENAYTQKEINDYKKYMCYSINDTIIEQIENVMNCVREVKDLTFPKHVPVLKIIAKETIENNEKTLDIGGMEYQESHLNRIGNHATSVILDGSHFIYYDQLEEIARLTDEFIDKLK